MNNNLQDIWVYLSASPLAHLTLTLVAFQIGFFIYKKGAMHPLLNPVLIAVILVVGFLLSSGTSYQDYFDGAQFVHFLLGPATVALAIPLYRQFERVKQSALAIFTGCHGHRRTIRRLTLTNCCISYLNWHFRSDDWAHRA